MNGLYLLSFLPTGDHERAAKRLVDGIDDCVMENLVFRKRAGSRAKRIIVENAIGELKPPPGLPSRSVSAAAFSQSEP